MMPPRVAPDNGPHEGCAKRGGICDCTGRPCAVDERETPSSQSNIAIKHPTRLYAEPLDSLGLSDEWMLVAEDDQGNRLTIVASRDRFSDALMGQGIRQMTQAEQVREMYLRGEVEIESFERALDRAR